MLEVLGRWLQHRSACRAKRAVLVRFVGAGPGVETVAAVLLVKRPTLPMICRVKVSYATGRWRSRQGAGSSTLIFQVPVIARYDPRPGHEIEILDLLIPEIRIEEGPLLGAPVGCSTRVFSLKTEVIGGGPGSLIPRLWW